MCCSIWPWHICADIGNILLQIEGSTLFKFISGSLRLTQNWPSTHTYIKYYPDNSQLTLTRNEGSFLWCCLNDYCTWSINGIDLSCIPFQCVRTIVPEQGWGGYFYTSDVFLSTLTHWNNGEGLLITRTQHRTNIDEKRWANAAHIDNFKPRFNWSTTTPVFHNCQHNAATAQCIWVNVMELHGHHGQRSTAEVRGTERHFLESWCCAEENIWQENMHVWIDNHWNKS